MPRPSPESRLREGRSSCDLDRPAIPYVRLAAADRRPVPVPATQRPDQNAARLAREWVRRRWPFRNRAQPEVPVRETQPYAVVVAPGVPTWTAVPAEVSRRCG